MTTRCEGCGTGWLDCIRTGGPCCRACECKQNAVLHVVFRGSRAKTRPLDPRGGVAGAARDSAQLIAGICQTCRQPLYGRLCWNPGCADSIHDSEQSSWPEFEGPVIVTRGVAAR